MSLAKIASALGLSVTTASRALAGYDDVAERTRARVAKEAARIGYRPSAAGRRLQSGRAGAIGIVLPTGPGCFDDSFFLRLLSAIGAPLRAAGLDMLVTTARPGAEENEAYRHLVEGGRVDGMFVARTRTRDPRIAYLLARGTPFVVHGRARAKAPFAYVDVDGETAFKEATERLVGLGHRAIGMIGAPSNYCFARPRRAGWARALAEAGLRAGPFLAAEPTEENGFRLAGAMLAGADAPTALVCATDRLAIGALHAIKSAGMRPGTDVSLIGYDDLPQAAYCDPPLTTIAQLVDHAGALMVEMLVALLAGADPASQREVLQARLIARGTDGPPRTPAGASANKKTFKGGKNVSPESSRPS